jgi:hypothetical protein
MRAIKAVPGFIVLWGGLFAIAAAGQARGPQVAAGVLEDVRVEAMADTVEVRIWVHGSTSHRLQFFKGSPNQVVVDFNGVGRVVSAARIPVGKLGVIAVRTGQFQPFTARLVVDLSGQILPHEFNKTEDGFVLRLGNPAAPRAEAAPIKPPEKKAEEMAKDEIKIEETPLPKPSEKIAAKLAEELPPAKPIEETEAAEPPEKPAVAAPSDLARILEEMNAERERLRIRQFRASAEGAFFAPRGGVLKETYRGGFVNGGAVGFRIAGPVDVWVTAGHYGKTASFEGGVRTTRLIPMAAGFDLRFVRGIVNPYAGFGLGLFQYREEGPVLTTRASKSGLIGRAGIFLRIGEALIIDFFARYLSCSVEVGGARVDLGGLHLGIGLGGEF